MKKPTIAEFVRAGPGFVTVLASALAACGTWTLQIIRRSDADVGFVVSGGHAP
jgi:hypothetical protein